MFDRNEVLATDIIYKYKVDPSMIKTVLNKYDFKKFKNNDSLVDDGNTFLMKINYDNGEVYKIKGCISPVGNTDDLRNDILNLANYNEIPNLL